VTLLADTHILIWTAEGTLPGKAVPYIEDPDNIILFSPVSIWEAVIKRALNRPDFQIDPLVLYHGLLRNGYTELAVTSRHALAVGALPLIHKDPFDRLLIAQARMEGAVLLTSDETVTKYPGQIIFIH
jgi:PIN domain nuclease of toxin-antitoxin system